MTFAVQTRFRFFRGHCMLDADAGSCQFNWCNGKPTPLRLAIALGASYAVLAFCCWKEVNYRWSSVSLRAQIVWVRPSLGKRHRLDVRYTFADPDTGIRRVNTVSIPENKRPSGRTATIQFIPGDAPTSRLATQARPVLVSVFVWTNIGILVVVAGVIVLLAWQANRTPFSKLAPRERAIARFKRRREVESAWRRGE